MSVANHDHTTSEDPEVHRLARNIFQSHARSRALLAGRLDRARGVEVATLVKTMRGAAARLAELIAATPDGQRAKAAALLAHLGDAALAMAPSRLAEEAS